MHSAGSPLLNRAKNQKPTGISLQPTGIPLLTDKMMEKTFGELIRNYVEAISKSIPKNDTTLKTKLSFLFNNNEVALVFLAGIDTWDTPIKDLNQDQGDMGFRALSWISSEIMHKLSHYILENNNFNEQEYKNFTSAVNSMSLFRAALMKRTEELIPSSFSQYSGTISNLQDASFNDVRLVQTNLGMSFMQGTYQPRTGEWASGAAVAIAAGTYYFYGDQAQQRGQSSRTHRSSQNLTALDLYYLADMYSHLLQLQVQITEAGIHLAGKLIDASMAHTKDAINLIHTGINESSQVVEGAYNAANVDAQGCGDLAAQCCGCCVEVACKCPIPDGECGILCCLGTISCCFVGVSAAANAICGSDDKPEDDPSSSMDNGFDAQDFNTDSASYHDVTTAGTICYDVCFGLPLAWRMLDDTCTMFNSKESARNRRTAKQDCLTATLCVTGTMLGGYFLLDPVVFGPKVALNMAITMGNCAHITSHQMRKGSELSTYLGVTHPDKHGLTALQLKTLIQKYNLGMAQANRDSEVSTLNWIVTANTSLYNTAYTEKREQWTVVRRMTEARTFMTCGAYGSSNTHEKNRQQALTDIQTMKNGSMPESISTQPPRYEQQPYQQPQQPMMK